MKSEFQLIEQYFKANAGDRGDVLFGIGDDCALLQAPAEQQLVMTMDTLNAGIHFPETTPADAIAYKTLAVNLSDLAAMGADPAWVCLSVSLPEADESWLQNFCQGFSRLLNEHSVQLIGGDTCRGPLSLTVQATGFVDKDKALRRDAAQVGDLIYVTGSLGAAGLGLQAIQHKYALNEQARQHVISRLYYPTPRVKQGQQLCGIANAAIDLSDGLVADIQHILNASQVGATIDTTQLPIDKTVLKYCSAEQALGFALTAGDDYELCFTLPEKACSQLTSRLMDTCTLIGRIEAESGLRFLDQQGQSLNFTQQGYQHFSGS